MRSRPGRGDGPGAGGAGCGPSRALIPLRAAIAQLERDDCRYQSDFQEFYGEALASMVAGDLRPVEIPSSFGPDD